jgi:hypothetical protein
MSNPEKEQAQHREECRREVRRYLAERSALALPSAAIRRKLQTEGSHYCIEDIEAALDFLAGIEPAQVRVEHDSLGATKYYKATSAGVIAHERSL